MRWITHFLDPNPAPGAPAPAPSAPPAPTPPATAPPAPAPSPQKVNALVDRLIGRHGSAESALQVLATQVLSYEDRVDADTRTITELRGRVPDGAVILKPGEQVETWNAVQELRLTSKAAREMVAENARLKGESEGTKRERLGREAAKAGGYNSDIFLDLTRDLVVELKDATVKDKAGKESIKKVPHVRPKADDKAAFELFHTWAERERRPYLVALMVPDSAAPTPGTQAAPAPGTPAASWPHQQPPSTEPDSPTAAVLTQLRERYPTPSQLRQKQTQQQGA